MKIKNENIGVLGAGFTQRLNALGAEARVQLLLVDPEAGRKTHQCRSQKTAEQDGNQNLGDEFWQCG